MIIYLGRYKYNQCYKSARYLTEPRQTIGYHIYLLQYNFSDQKGITDLFLLCTHQQENKLMQIKNKQKHKSTKWFLFENHFSQQGVLAYMYMYVVLHDRLFNIAHSKQKFINYSGIYLTNDIIGFQMGYWIS